MESGGWSRTVIVDMRGSDESPPVPLADRAYSGKFIVRVPPETHRELMLEAAEERVSLNRLVNARLSRPTASDPMNLSGG